MHHCLRMHHLHHHLKHHPQNHLHDRPTAVGHERIARPCETFFLQELHLSLHFCKSCTCPAITLKKKITRGCLHLFLFKKFEIALWPRKYSPGVHRSGFVARNMRTWELNAHHFLVLVHKCKLYVLTPNPTASSVGRIAVALKDASNKTQDLEVWGKRDLGRIKKVAAKGLARLFLAMSLCTWFCRYCCCLSVRSFLLLLLREGIHPRATCRRGEARGWFRRGGIRQNLHEQKKVHKENV